MKEISSLKQGDLDGLCSIYAVLNAVRYVLDYDPVDYKQDYDGACKIFKMAFQNNANLDTVLDGAERDVPMKYLETLSEFLPIQYRLLKQNETFYDALNQGVLVMGFTGYDNHWTVTTHHDNDFLYLFDSTKYKKFKKKNIVFGEHKDDTKIIIDRQDVIVISQKT